MNARPNQALEGAVPLLDTANLRRALGSFPTGVTIVTTLDEAGALQGLTANAFSAVSLEPPLVLVCVGHNSRSYKSFVRAGRFAIHILSEDQAEIATHFARPGSVRGAEVSWHLNQRGLPILDRYVTLIECALHAEHHGGDHAILLGRVEGISHGPQDARPLLYHRGRLLRAQALPD
jgi:3-hydroxy-9,10-secoandrosta-1,3,5(10)-triene-9,17-dione monooxygenase reductase component